MQDNKIFKPKEDGGCYEILILKISPRTIIANMPLKHFELSRKITKKSHTTVHKFSRKIAPCQANWR